MTTAQILAQAKREAHTYSHRKLRGEIMSWVDAMMNNDLPDDEIDKLGQLVVVYYSAGKRKDTNFRKLPSFYQLQLTGLVAGLQMEGRL